VTAQEHRDPPRGRRRLGVLIPLILFTALALLFWYGLQTGDPSRLPSALIGKPVPEFTLPPLDGLNAGGSQVPGFTNADLAQGEPTIVNVWASWCVPCHEEHPLLTKLAERSGLSLFGINYKDNEDSARRFLGRYGNPFTRVGVDRTGRAAIDWGVYGVPETYVIAGDGTIAYRHVGPLTEESLEQQILPAIGHAKRNVAAD
jgi:cytochrome c biogenesis protein CcmG, thiol:disulfide interchange protein DsbE